METTYLSNQFLIAMPSLRDQNFSKTVTYICEHNADGALGIIINRPLELSLKDLLEHLQFEKLPSALAHAPVYSGGPVQQEQGFVIHTPLGAWDSTLQVTDTIGITTSRDILQALAEQHSEAPEQAFLALGYAGWGSGQLEQEMAENAWLSVPASADILFNTPSEQRWQAAARQLGIDLSLLSGQAGHA